jgi:signal transduction histidine kinase
VAYRICHEAVDNARNHANATEVTVAATATGGGVEITVVDDGIGVDPSVEGSPPGHYGLTSMRERAALAGGWWRLERGVPRGSVVRFWLPSPADDAGD